MKLKTIVSNKSRNRDGYVRGKATYNDGDIRIKHNSRLYLAEIDTNSVGMIRMYALPSNNYHNNWFETIISIDNYIESKDIIRKFWTVAKPKQKVKGYIDNDKFVIKQFL